MNDESIYTENDPNSYYVFSHVYDNVKIITDNILIGGTF